MTEKMRKAIVEVLAADRRFQEPMSNRDQADAMQELLEAVGELREVYYDESPSLELVEN